MERKDTVELQAVDNDMLEAITVLEHATVRG